MSDFADKRRREFMERMKYFLGEKRWLRFMELSESGDLAKQRRRMLEILESDQADQYLAQHDFRKQFGKNFN
ncbi:MAG TPA: hypothetical protein VFU57_05740 [Candidatus Acidoferrales bacterium]|nr:hypothetical protein [Candidatus Acidoferrales bacterium]